MTSERSEKLIQPNAEKQYEVTEDDLPLACPMPGMQLWNSHPRIFLPVETSRLGEVPLLLGGVHAQEVSGGAAGPMRRSGSPNHRATAARVFAGT